MSLTVGERVNRPTVPLPYTSPHLNHVAYCRRLSNRFSSTVPQATDLPHLNHEAALATAEGHDELLARERRRRLLAGHELNVRIWDTYYCFTAMSVTNRLYQHPSLLVHICNWKRPRAGEDSSWILLTGHELNAECRIIIINFQDMLVTNHPGWHPPLIIYVCN